MNATGRRTAAEGFHVFGPFQPIVLIGMLASLQPAIAPQLAATNVRSR
jgi:hypothetical protein